MQPPSEALRLGLRDLPPKQGIEDFTAQASCWLSPWCEQKAVRPFQWAELVDSGSGGVDTRELSFPSSPAAKKVH